MANKASEYVLTLKEEMIKQSNKWKHINLKYDFNEAINKLLDEQNQFTWITSIFQLRNIKYLKEFHMMKFIKSDIGNLKALNERNVKNPINAVLIIQMESMK